MLVICGKRNFCNAKGRSRSTVLWFIDCFRFAETVFLHTIVPLACLLLHHPKNEEKKTIIDQIGVHVDVPVNTTVYSRFDYAFLSGFLSSDPISSLLRTIFFSEGRNLPLIQSARQVYAVELVNWFKSLENNEILFSLEFGVCIMKSAFNFLFSFS